MESQESIQEAMQAQSQEPMQVRIENGLESNVLALENQLALLKTKLNQNNSELQFNNQEAAALEAARDVAIESFNKRNPKRPIRPGELLALGANINPDQLDVLEDYLANVDPIYDKLLVLYNLKFSIQKRVESANSNIQALMKQIIVAKFNADMNKHAITAPKLTQKEAQVARKNQRRHIN